MSNQDGPLRIDPISQRLSPDGRWVLWWDAKAHDVSISGARLDGSGHFRFPKSKAQWDNM